MLPLGSNRVVAVPVEFVLFESGDADGLNEIDIFDLLVLDFESRKKPRA